MDLQVLGGSAGSRIEATDEVLMGEQQPISFNNASIFSILLTSSYVHDDALDLGSVLLRRLEDADGSVDGGADWARWQQEG